LFINEFFSLLEKTVLEFFKFGKLVFEFLSIGFWKDFFRCFRYFSFESDLFFVPIELRSVLSFSSGFFIFMLRFILLFFLLFLLMMLLFVMWLFMFLLLVGLFMLFFLLRLLLGLFMLLLLFEFLFVFRLFMKWFGGVDESFLDILFGHESWHRNLRRK